MNPDDWKRFAEDGDSWIPGSKPRAVILAPGSVFVMRMGVIHSVLTLRNASR